jgi:hypothetical protein
MIDSISKLVDALDGPAKLAELLGCTSQNISMWSVREEIPTGWHYRLHLLAEAKGLAYNRHKLFGIPKGFAKGIT